MLWTFFSSKESKFTFHQFTDDNNHKTYATSGCRWYSRVHSTLPPYSMNRSMSPGDMSQLGGQLCACKYVKNCPSGPFTYFFSPSTWCFLLDLYAPAVQLHLSCLKTSYYLILLSYIHTSLCLTCLANFSMFLILNR